MGSKLGCHDITIEEISAPGTVNRFGVKARLGKWECLDWSGSLNRDGYGVFTVQRVPMLAHRVAWMMRHGTHVPDGLVIDHLCCNPRCVNADHLEAVTAEENGRRITSPPAGWVQVASKEYGTRRRYVDVAAREAAVRARRSLKPLLAPMLVDCGANVDVLWQVRDDDTQRPKPRQRRFTSRVAAEAFLDTLTVA